MLHSHSPFADGDHSQHATAFTAWQKWRRPHHDAAADYALDGTARSMGAPRHQRPAGLGGDWTADREVRWFSIRQREAA